jgi:hypothetical protein
MANRILRLKWNSTESLYKSRPRSKPSLLNTDPVHDLSTRMCWNYNSNVMTFITLELFFSLVEVDATIQIRLQILSVGC